MALPRERRDGPAAYDRARRTGVILHHPGVEGRQDIVGGRSSHGSGMAGSVIESRLRDEARLEGARLAAREMAHLLNNDLAVAVGFVDLLQAQIDLPPHLRDLLLGAIASLDSAARHVDEMQHLVRVVVKDTPAGASLDLERSSLD